MTGEDKEYIRVKEVIAEDFKSRVGADSFSIDVNHDIILADFTDIGTNTGTGTKIGTTTSQKLSFYGASPVTQRATTGTTTGFTAGSGTAVNDDSTFTGDTGTRAYTIGDIVKAMKELGLLGLNA